MTGAFATLEWTRPWALAALCLPLLLLLLALRRPRLEAAQLARQRPVVGKDRVGGLDERRTSVVVLCHPTSLSSSVQVRLKPDTTGAAVVSAFRRTCTLR